MIRSLFPDDVVTVAASTGMWEGRLYPEEERFVANAVAKRRREFTAGRLCAREALARLGIERHPLPSGPDRAPLWPPGITGSISHCEGYCGAAVARLGAVTGIGLDVEPAHPLDDDLIARVCTRREIAALGSLPGYEPGLQARLVFVAKESVYKSVFKEVGRALEFEDVEVTFHPERSAFTARLTGASGPHGGPALVEGRFARTGTHLFCGVTLRSPERRPSSS